MNSCSLFFPCFYGCPSRASIICPFRAHFLI
jgi:hypothetical protein